MIYSKIISCKINNKSVNKLNYTSIIKDVYIEIGSGIKIIKNTILNIQTVEIHNKGFKYMKKLGISSQGVDSNSWIKEIMKQCYYNKIKFSIKIQLQDKQIIMIEV